MKLIIFSMNLYNFYDIHPWVSSQRHDWKVRNYVSGEASGVRAVRSPRGHTDAKESGQAATSEPLVSTEKCQSEAAAAWKSPLVVVVVVVSSESDCPSSSSSTDVGSKGSQGTSQPLMMEVNSGSASSQPLTPGSHCNTTKSTQLNHLVNVCGVSAQEAKSWTAAWAAVTLSEDLCIPDPSKRKLQLRRTSVSSFNCSQSNWLHLWHYQHIPSHRESKLFPQRWTNLIVWKWQ